MKQTSFYCNFSGYESLRIVPMKDDKTLLKIWIDQDREKEKFIDLLVDEQMYQEFLNGKRVIDIVKTFDIIVVRDSNDQVVDFFRSDEIDEHPIFECQAWNVFNFEVIKEYNFRVDSESKVV